MVKNRYCIIMAGGVGSRFWPISRNNYPKQFLDILGTGRSFLQSTVDRFKKIIPVENILVVSSLQYKELIEKQIPEIPTENILLESRKRNTAPCIAYATYKLYKKDPSASVVVSPSDHLILNEEKFLNTINVALDHAALTDKLFTLGIKPTRPETQYGYIQMNVSNKKTIGDEIAYQVKTFTEKPNYDMAKVLFESGEFLWNSGIFVWSLESIKREMELHLPEIAHSFSDLSPYYYTPDEQPRVNDAYDGIDAISIDYGVMEKTSKTWVFEASFGWSDLGTWDSLYAQSLKDDRGNLVKVRENLIEDVDNSIIMSNEENKLMVVKGLKDYMIISTKDVLMVCPRADKDFKAILSDLVVNDLTKFQ